MNFDTHQSMFMNTLALTLLMLALGFGCSSTSTSSRNSNASDSSSSSRSGRNSNHKATNNRYPAWFINMPTAGVSAVGYSNVNAYSDADIVSAYKNGMEQLSFATLTHVFGEAIYQEVPGIGKIPRGDNIKQVSSELDSASVVGIDTLQASEMTFVLLASSDLTVGKGRLQKMSSVRPSWVTELPRGGKYTVGVSEHYYYEYNAWLAAEKQARLQLAYTIVSTAKEVSRSDGQRAGGASIVSTNSKLSGAQVVSRWTNGSEYYVLMSLSQGVPSSEDS